MADRSGAGHPLWELTTSRILEFWRDPGALFWTFGFPVVLAVALGLAFRTAPAPTLRVAVACEGPCPELVQALRGRDELTLEQLARPRAIERLRQAKVDLVLAGGEHRELEAHYDPTRPEGPSARRAIELALNPSAAPRFRLRDERHTEPGARYIDFLLPGLLGLNLLGSSVWGIGFSVVEARRKRLLKQLAATPMKKSHYLLSFMLSRLVFLVLEVVLLVGFGALVFDVPVRGSLGALLALSLFGSFSFTGLALWIAAVPRSIEVASGWANLAMLPMWLFSGAFFSYERFPEALLPAIRALPLTALNDALRAVMNDGASLAACASELLVLLAWALVSFTIALRTFRWQ